MATITKLDSSFSSTGSMWSCIYDSRFNREERTSLALSDAKDAIEANNTRVNAVKKAEGEFIVISEPVIKGLLNTVVISKIRSPKRNLLLMTTFPELTTKKIITGELLEVIEYSGGYEGRLSIKVINDEADRDHTLDFFDTKYLENFNKYKIGQVYDFHIAALVEKIQHRDKDNLDIKMTPEMKKKMQTNQKTLSTKNMFALYPVNDFDTEVFLSYTPFQGLYPKTFKHPRLPDNDEIYIFEIACHYLDEKNIIYKIPAMMTDGVIVSSDNKNKKNIQFKEGDSVDIVGILQGSLAVK